ncbi:hypothetical protein PR048_007244 [Dryococelus australis]|uniref:Uncharacterized protein n=1 Tax=Dryococelus australis TaxID=614101 RepID=A0ABQ9IED0_9NEOP|nr:hypothetical protein PR048_007244 [Dryococelus australis]
MWDRSGSEARVIPSAATVAQWIERSQVGPHATPAREVKKASSYHGVRGSWGLSEQRVDSFFRNPRPPPPRARYFTCEAPRQIQRPQSWATRGRINRLPDSSASTSRPSDASHAKELGQWWRSGYGTLASHHGDLGSIPGGFTHVFSCWTMSLASGFSRGTPVGSILAFQRHNIQGSHFMSYPGITSTYGSQSESPSLGECCLSLGSLPTPIPSTGLGFEAVHFKELFAITCDEDVRSSGRHIAIGSLFVRPALHASEPIADLGGKHLANPTTARCGATANEHTAEAPILGNETNKRSLTKQCQHANIKIQKWSGCVTCQRGSTVAEWLACSPRTKANLVQSPASGIPTGRCRSSAGFLGDLPFHVPLHSGAAPYSPLFTLTGSQDLDVILRHDSVYRLYLNSTDKLRSCSGKSVWAFSSRRSRCQGWDYEVDTGNTTLTKPPPGKTHRAEPTKRQRDEAQLAPPSCTRKKTRYKGERGERIRKEREREATGPGARLRETPSIDSLSRLPGLMGHEMHADPPHAIIPKLPLRPRQAPSVGRKTPPCSCLALSDSHYPPPRASISIATRGREAFSHPPPTPHRQQPPGTSPINP